ncbi:MAG: DUF6048 family protein [Bacteroidales bacterium]
MNIFKYLFLIPAMVTAMNLSLAASENDTIFHPALRFGVDVSGFARQIIEPEVFPIEASVDFEWKENFFAVAEAGMSTVNMEKDTHRYIADGYFGRAGADFNLLHYITAPSNDVILVSLRYGYSRSRQEAPLVIISDNYWGDHQTAVDADIYQAHWIEAGIGLKTEIFRSLFIGWSLRGKILLSDTSDPEMDPFYVGGYGGSGSATAMTLHYSLYYRFPIR